MPSRGRAGRPPPARSGVVHQRSHRLAERVRGDARVPDPGEEVPQVRLGVARVTELPVGGANTASHRFAGRSWRRRAMAVHQLGSSIDRQPASLFGLGSMTRPIPRMRITVPRTSTDSESRSSAGHVMAAVSPIRRPVAPTYRPVMVTVRARGQPLLAVLGKASRVRSPRQGPAAIFSYRAMGRRRSHCFRIAQGGQCTAGYGKGGRTWGRFAPGSESRSTGLSVGQDRKSTRLNSSHVEISYAVF